MKIDVGCGSKVTPGFVGCDIRPVGDAVIVCAAWEFGTDGLRAPIEEFRCRHAFEHFTFKQGEMTLKSWHSVLIPGGKVNIIVPDLEWHCREYLKNKSAHAEAGFFGWQRISEAGAHRSATDDLWDVHKSGYCEDSLRRLATRHGFERFTRIKSSPEHLDVEFFKPA